MSQENTEQVEISFGIIGERASGVSIRFSDGVHTLPEHVVLELGGPDELQKLADGLTDVTFTEFMEGFHAVRTARKVNAIQADFVKRHFNPRL